MTVFVDASAMVAIIAREPDRDALYGQIADERNLLWSAISCWESVSSLSRSYEIAVVDARQRVEQLARHMELQLVAIGEGELSMALDAYGRFGKRSGHRARLNMGDCFAYACAKAKDARLLYKGDDFALTDLA